MAVEFYNFASGLVIIKLNTRVDAVYGATLCVS